MLGLVTEYPTNSDYAPPRVDPHRSPRPTRSPSPRRSKRAADQQIRLLGWNTGSQVPVLFFGDRVPLNYEVPEAKSTTRGAAHVVTDADSAQPETAVSKPRPRLLELLRNSDNPLDVYELAAATGLHISTVRFHLAVLARDNRITLRTTPRATPGRPRTVYDVAEDDAPPDRYRSLAGALAAGMAGTSRTRRRRAEEAGRQWSTTLLAETSRTVPPDAAARQITHLLAGLQFDPELTQEVPAAREREIRLRACPYRDVALEHPDVVCSVHLGLLKGILDQLGAPFASARIVPFVEPQLCLAYLTAAEPAPGTPGSA